MDVFQKPFTVVPFQVADETFFTPYKVIGNLEGRTRRPLIVVHGGPSLSSDYLFPIADLADSGVPVIFYDQLGSGRSTSDVLRDKPHEGENNFWSVDLMIDELVNLLKKLSIAGDFDALGHSWGGMLLAEFIIRGRPQAAGLKRLILSSSLPSLALWHEVTMKLLATFPQEVQEGFEGGFNDIERLRPAAQAFFERYGCRARPFPEGLQRSINAGLDNPGPHLGLWDNGELIHPKPWDIIDKLHLINVPTLITNGGDEQAQDHVVAPFFWNIPKAKWVTFQNSTHTAFLEERERYIRVVEEFLRP